MGRGRLLPLVVARPGNRRAGRLRRARPDRGRGEPAVEVGWSISPERWGQGLAPEAGRACVDWAFEVAELERVVSYTLHENRASRRVMEKIGLRYSRDFIGKGFEQVLYERAVGC